MDIVKYHKEKKRMCKEYTNMYNQCTTGTCPMAALMLDMNICNFKDVGKHTCELFEEEHIEEAIKLVETWLKE